MNLTEEQLKEVESMAGLFFSPGEIGIVLEMELHEIEDLDDIIKSKNGDPIYMAYHKGRLTTEVELRNATKQAALNGSNPAQTMMFNLRQQTQ